jgi:hypothetical protein
VNTAFLPLTWFCQNRILILWALTLAKIIDVAFAKYKAPIWRTDLSRTCIFQMSDTQARPSEIERSNYVAGGIEEDLRSARGYLCGQVTVCGRVWGLADASFENPIENHFASICR